MEKTVVILQDNESFIKSVAALFEGDGTYRVAGFAADGVTGMELITKCDPDYVILDILLPGMDGLAVLERIREEGLRTKPILLTSVIRDDIAERAIDLGARYILLKPFRFDILLTRMQQLSGGDPEPPSAAISGLDDGLEAKISRIMITAGFSPKIKGYHFLREGIRLAITQPEVMESVMGKLYPIISERFGSTVTRVERAIRHALALAWNRDNFSVINKMFGFSCFRNTRPTNREFIALMSDRSLLMRI